MKIKSKIVPIITLLSAALSADILDSTVQFRKNNSDIINSVQIQNNGVSCLFINEDDSILKIKLNEYRINIDSAFSKGTEYYFKVSDIDSEFIKKYSRIEKVGSLNIKLYETSDSFNVADKINGRLPWRKLIYFGKNKNYKFIYFEKGGHVNYTKLIIIKNMLPEISANYIIRNQIDGPENLHNYLKEKYYSNK